MSEILTRQPCSVLGYERLFIVEARQRSRWTSGGRTTGVVLVVLVVSVEGKFLLSFLTEQQNIGHYGNDTLLAVKCNVSTFRNHGINVV